jgi:glycosyltransferase involved in cell wall biosynthesis
VLRIVGYETGGNIGYSADIFKTADSIGVGDRVSILPAVSRLRLMELCREGDVGLAFFPEPTGPADSYAGASNKVFDYLCCGLPVLIPNNKEWQNFFYGTNLAVACNPTNTASIAEAILWLYHHPNQARSMGECGRERILKGWNYEEQFSPVLRSFKNFCFSTPPS